MVLQSTRFTLVLQSESQNIGTPRSNSPSGLRKSSPTTGTELCRKVSSLVLLSLGRPGAHQVWLLGKPMLRLMLLGPLLHRSHLVLLGLGQCRRVVFSLL